MSRMLVSLFACALLAATGPAALAHAYPKTMDPPANSALTTPPKEIVINFTEGIDLDFSSLEVLDSHGQRVDRNDAHLAPHNARQFIVDVSSLAPGTYKVVWSVTAVDTHKTHGSYDFTIAR